VATLRPEIASSFAALIAGSLETSIGIEWAFACNVMLLRLPGRVTELRAEACFVVLGLSLGSSRVT
jgi:hypothetical protein